MLKKGMDSTPTSIVETLFLFDYVEKVMDSTSLTFTSKVNG